MQAVGIIVEYNPFHNGHAYHLQQAKQQTGADCVIAVMSGHFAARRACSCIKMVPHKNGFSRWCRLSR
ncbi:nucleotidyltransferase family protein [Priestia megaterium]